MPFQPGNKLAKGGRADKPFADALRMELAAAGEDHKALRKIARNLIDLAQKAELAALPAINAIADRLDGKPAQESTVTFNDRSPDEMSDAELINAIREAARRELSEEATDKGQLN
jgi:hypothetical protein